MKRALALLEQTKHTMPHLPRPTSSEEEDLGSMSQTTKNNEDRTAPALAYARKEKRMPSAGRPSRDKLQNNISSAELSSRKSTAVSSTTRIGSSGNAVGNKKQKRVAYTGAQTMNADLNMNEGHQPVYELSLNKQKKPPHKLKPLARPTDRDNNMATSVLEIENAYQKELLNDIDNDINEYLDASKIFKEMKSAFNADDIIANTDLSQSMVIKHKGTKKQKSELDPILEETNQALAIYQPNMTLQEQRAKKNEQLKNKVKKLTGGSGSSGSLPSLPYSSNTAPGDKDSETFITGTKIAQQPTEDDHIIQEYESQLHSSQGQRKKKHYKYEEDELLDDLDQHERDMNEMLKYLSEVEDLIKGNDLKSIQQMMDVTKETMNQHFQAYDKFKDQITSISSQADQAISSLNFYADEEEKKDDAKKSAAIGRQLERVIENKDEEQDNLGGDKKGVKHSQEGKKKSIVNQLMNMNSSMRDFATDIESRLDRAYKVGATKKFGYDGITNTAMSGDLTEKEDRELNKMSIKAAQFIDQNSAASILRSVTSASGSSYSAVGRKSSAASVKALPPSESAPRRKGGSLARKSTNDDIKHV